MSPRIFSAIAAFVLALSGPAWASPEPAGEARATLEICNNWIQIFKVAVDGERFVPLKVGSCLKARVPVGAHLVLAHAYLFSQDWFAHPAWIVQVPPTGAVARFGHRGPLVDIVSLKGGPLEHKVPDSARPRAMEPVFSGNPAGLPGGIYHCWSPIAMADVLFDRMSPIFVTSGYWSIFGTAVGVGSFGVYDIDGYPACLPGNFFDDRVLASLRAHGPGTARPRTMSAPSLRPVSASVAARIRATLLKARSIARPSVLGALSRGAAGSLRPVTRPVRSMGSIFSRVRAPSAPSVGGGRR
jgi:hypothetical protein